MNNKKLKTSEHISDFLNFLKTLKEQYNYAYSDVNSLDKETQDILHQIEFGDYDSRSKYATQLKNVRKKRRVHKDFIDINTSIYNFITSNDCTHVIKQLEQILGEVRKQEKYVFNKRDYHSRVIQDLPICKK